MKTKNQKSKCRAYSVERIADSKTCLSAIRYPLNAKIFFSFLFVFCILFSGCEAFTRKFTREPKKRFEEAMVIAPEEYKAPLISKNEQYRQYFLFWKSWQDELIEALLSSRSNKKKINCADKATMNLLNLRGFLNENKQKELDVYIKSLGELKEAIMRDTYGKDGACNRQKAERLKRNILRDFNPRFQTAQ